MMRRPPYWPSLILNWFCSSDYIEEIEGDLLEYYERDLKYRSSLRANFNFTINTIKFINHTHMKNKSCRSSSNHVSLIDNWFKTALRSAFRQKAFSFLNLSGLVLGLSSSLFLFAYITDELSYDGYHRDVDRIFRLTDGVKFDDDFTEGAITPSGWTDGLSRQIPEIATTGRINQATRFNPTIKYENRIFVESSFIFIDSTLLNIFDYDFLYKAHGNPLTIPNAVLINRQIAKKYFGDRNPLGETLLVNGETSYEVTGVINMPKNNSFKFDFAALLIPPKEDRLWTHTFIKTERDLNKAELEEKLAVYLQDTYGERPYASRQSMSPTLQPLTSIHHHSDLKFEYSTNSSITYIYLFSAICSIILSITVCNFINLYTAKATIRSKEVNIRKVVGAAKKQITIQFLAEGILYVIVASLISLVTLLLANPVISLWSGKEIHYLEVFQTHHWLLIVVGILSIGIIAALYPALFLSTASLNSTPYSTDRSSSWVRKVLVITQFSLSTIMIIGAIVIGQQLVLFQNTELGFDKMNNLIIKITDENVKTDHQSFRNELLELAAITNVSFTQTIPGEREKMAVLVYKAENSDETTIIPTFLTDLNFAKTLGLKLTAGRYFDSSRPDDKNNCLINQAAAKLMGWSSEAIGKEMHAIDLGLKGKVVGVVKDFNFSSLHSEIEPLVIFPVLQFPQAFNSAIVNLRPGNTVSTLPKIEKVWRAFSPESPFDYSIINDDLNRLYDQDLKKGRVFQVFVILSVIISCLGLLGLTIYTLDKRTKEISIRKVLGASVQSITFFLSGHFLKLIGIANTLALPISYWMASKWLEGFSYRITLEPKLFLTGIFFSFGIALFTIIILTLKKALANPAGQLRSE